MDRLTALLKERGALLALFLLVHATQVLVSLLWLYALAFDAERARSMLVGYDHFANAALKGDPAQTISARAYFGTLRGSRGWCLFCKFADWFDKNHCAKSIEP